MALESKARILERFQITPRDLPPSTEVLKEGQLFFISLPTGEVPAGNMGGLGLYFQDTRYLSTLELSLEESPLVLLSATTRGSHAVQIELTNPEISRAGKIIPLQSIHVRLFRVLEGGLYQRCRLINFNPEPITVTLSFVFAADFADIFEVRGQRREQRGEFFPPTSEEGGFCFHYRGRDKIDRYTRVKFQPPPQVIEVEKGKGKALFRLELPPQKKVYLNLKITPATSLLPPEKRDLEMAFISAYLGKEKEYLDWQKEGAEITTDNEVFNQIFVQAAQDLRALSTTYHGKGMVIEAGIPWFAAPFGRDSLITSWQTLIFNPQIAKHTLRFLAHYQGKEINPLRDERPGKILHEMRWGEMANCGEIFAVPYYGSIDATLWFLMLIEEVFRWTKDEEFLAEMHLPFKRALDWCRLYGDLDGDGFLEYQREAPRGLENQGWKDSWNGVCDRTGGIPQGPIALVEVQAYYYFALCRGAEILALWGEEEEAKWARETAKNLQERFLKKFWLPEEEFLAFALDAEKEPVVATVSNAGQCLFTGILPPAYAQKVAERLFAPDMYSGWGIRTMGKREKPYNPMSYHNGSVWPHDNALIAQGLRDYQLLFFLDTLATSLFEAALYFPYRRFPELFCGFTRRMLGGPVYYPTACSLQAWSVSAVFLLLRSLLGISCDAEGIHVKAPMLPRGVREVQIKNLTACQGKVDLEFAQSSGKVYCNLLKREGKTKIIIEI